MKIFTRMYAMCLRWARHEYASIYLGIMSFAESIIFPIPVDVMLAPMSLARPDRAWWYAFVATITSVLGGLFGFLLGAYLGTEVLEPVLREYGRYDAYHHAAQWFKDYGIWIIFIAGFTPIPFKVFTITAGMLSENLLADIFPFTIAAFIGRAGRFYLVAGLMKLGGEKMEKKLHQYVDTIGWAVVLLILLAYIIYKYR